MPPNAFIGRYRMCSAFTTKTAIAIAGPTDLTIYSPMYHKPIINTEKSPR